MRTFSIKYCVILFLISGFASCDKNTEPIVIGVEVSGSSFDGSYIRDLEHTKGIKFVNDVDATERIITYETEGVAMWGLMKGNTLYYKIEGNKDVPPESQWDCGIGVDKDKFKCTPIYDE